MLHQYKKYQRLIMNEKLIFVFFCRPLWRGGKLGLDQWLGDGKAGNKEIVIGGRTVGEEKKKIMK